MEISEDFSKFSINQSQRLPSLRSLQIEKLPTQAQTNTCDSSTSEKTTSSDDTIKDLPEKSVVEEQFCKLLDDLGLKDDVKIKIISNYNLERKWELIKMNNNTKAVDTPFDVKKFITFISNASISDLSGFELAKLRKKLTYQATSALISKLVEEGLLDEMEKITKKLFQGTFIGSRKKWEIQLEILKLLDIILRSQEQAGNILKKKILVYTKKLILDYHLDKETQLILNQREYPKSIFETSSFCAPLENRILFFKILTNLLKIVDDVVSVFDGSENEVTVSSADQNVTKEEYLNLFDAVFDDSMYNGENLLDLFEKENKFIFQSLFLELKYCVFERHKNLSGGDSKSNYIFNSLADGTYRWEKIIQARTKKYKTAEANEYIVKK
ncbi:hypothetical protein HK099_003991 [Clydaea vesicula]|uniref:Uncharacterized protein n=1 Tax=Clydaea vesicula TaxID=447962 RepID=A0AAD5U2J2_9FUNG|nr:hypothetical protein HK099_003991 [Clydaea vesicula]